GPLGNNYILLETDDLFIVLNMETGDIRSRMEMPYAYSYHEAVEKIPSLSGDLVFYLDTYESTMNIWDPWHGENGELKLKEKISDMGWCYRRTLMHEGSLYLTRHRNNFFHITRIGPDLGTQEWSCNDNLIDILDMGEAGIEAVLFRKEYDRYEIKCVDLETGISKWTILNVTSPGNIYPDRALNMDIDGDGDLEIIIGWYSYIRKEYGQDTEKLNALVSIHDENTGEILWKENSALICSGMDTDGNGWNEVLIEDLEEVRIIEPGRDRNRHVMDKQISGISFPYIWKDMNSDGYDDILFMTTDRYSTHSRPWEHVEELVLYDGFTSRLNKFTEEIGHITNAWTLKNSRNEDSIIISTYARIYSFPVDDRIDLMASKHIATPGKTIDLFATTTGSTDSFADAVVEWSSTDCLGTFSETEKPSPGVFKTTWTAPECFEGKVKLTSNVIINGLMMSDHVMVEIVDKLSIADPDEEEFNVELSVFPSRVREGGSTSISARIEGNFREENLDLKLFEVNGDETGIDMMKIGENIWMAKYMPEGNGEKILSFRAMIDRSILWEEFIRIMVLKEEKASPSEPIMPLLQIGAGTDSVLEEETVHLIIWLDGIELGGGMMLRLNDNEAGGSFSDLKELFHNTWTVEYTAPPGHMDTTITVLLDLNGKIIASHSTPMKIVRIESKEFIEAELKLTFDIINGIEDDKCVKHIFITGTKMDIPVPIEVTYIFITEGTYDVRIMSSESRYILHLKAVQISGSEGLMIMDISDGKSTVTTHEMLHPEQKEMVMVQDDDGTEVPGT
ncbi:MAG: hypothetical protein U9R75_08705, partial [Candidatus Thermoplasmatota archaeon]|nr:hypothetical protein [Candidatus Thermoplasmatota archaeon]